MIKNFRCLETGGLFDRQTSKKFKAIESLALRKLVMIHVAESLEDLRNPPGNRLEKLKGD